MRHLSFAVAALFLISCNATSQHPQLTTHKVLGKHLKEISGITIANGKFYAITDKPNAVFYEIDTASGNIKKEITIENATATDVESITSDGKFIYIGDTGDNDGNRTTRQILKIPVPADTASTSTVTAEIINFNFPEEASVQKKKENNFDCESILSFGDSLYVFTKDRADKETHEYVIPKTPGTFAARYIATLSVKGLITDAAMAPSGKEAMLIGYKKGHNYPFIIVLDGFKGNDFLSGTSKRIELADKQWDWQLESIAYDQSGHVYFANEGTDQVPATLYGIKRADIFTLKKAGKAKDKSADDDEPHLTLKGHLSK
jgi:hypothetical protein